MEKLLCLENYLDFKCKCDKCRHTCCAYWKIPVTKADYNRITKIDKSINHLKLESFTTPKRYAYISLDSNGKCPMLSKEGLCSLQMKYGVDSLTTVCMEYPRLVRYIRSPEIALSNACEGVVESLMNDSLVKFARVDKSFMYQNKYTTNQKFVKKNSVRNKISDIFMENPDISGFDAMGEYLSINIDKTFNKGFYGYIKAIYDEYFRKRADMTGYKNFMDNVNYDDISLSDNNMIANLIINHMFYMNFPFCNNNENVKENYIGLFTVYRMVQIAFSILKGDELVDIIAFLFRTIEHSNFYDNAYGLYYEII